MLDNDQKVKIVPLTSQRFPLQDCAAGRIFLAFNEMNTQLLVNQPQLASEINICRDQRYCIDHNGVGDGSTCIAVPLFAAGKSIVGCLALITPSFRTDEDRVNKELLPALKAAGEMISAQLGYNAYAHRRTA